MTSVPQVDKQLQEEFDKFSNALYSGKISVPTNLIELFKIGIMKMPPFGHKINFNKVKVLGSKKIKELSNGDINDLIKVVVNTKLEELFLDFPEAVDSMIKLEKFILSYNQHIDEFQIQLQQKKTLLLSLSGSSVRNNGLKIIN